MAKFKYRARDESQWERRANQKGSGQTGIILADYQIYQPKKGDNWVRILPPTWDDPDHYGIDVYVHYGIGPDRASVLCLQNMRDQPCPLCEARGRAERAGDEDLVGQLKPSKRVLVWVLDRKDEQKGPQVWAMPWTLDRDICKISRDKRTGEVFMVDHPDEGYDITFEREGEPPAVKYVGLQLSRRPSSVPQEALDYVEQHPVHETLSWRDYDDVKALYEGATGQRDDDAPKQGKPEAPRQHTEDDDNPLPDAEDDDDAPGAGEAEQKLPPAPKPVARPKVVAERNEAPAANVARAKPAGGGERAAALRAAFGGRR